MARRRIARWKTFRPEGHPIEYTLKRPWRIFWYLRKYRKKNFVTSQALLDLFNAQRRLLEKLRCLEIETVAAEARVKLAVVGDMMWVRTNWDGFLNPEVKKFLAQYDVLLGNLETPIDRTTPPAEWYKIDCAKFNSDEKLLTAFYDEKRARNLFTAVATANNHCFDRGDNGATETLKVLEELGIRQSGIGRTESEAGPVIFESKGIRFGMYATCYGYNDPKYKSELHLNKTPGLAPCPLAADDVDLSAVEKALAQMEADKVDFKIIYLHWGHEFELYPTEVQVELGRKLAAMGFDLVAGSHSHVVQPSEVCFINGYENLHGDVKDLAADPALQTSIITGAGGPRKTLIHYSLGNFITAMFFCEPKFGVIQGIDVFRSAKTGRVDWQLPETTLVYNALSVHNKLKKELLLVEHYYESRRKTLELLYPINLASCSYIYRHIHDTMSEKDIWRRPKYRDYRRVMTILKEKAN